MFRATEYSHLDEFRQAIREINEANGWHEESRPFEADIALLHSEVSEMFEWWRKGFEVDSPEIAEEMADVFIRLVDTADRAGVELDQAIILKMEKNKAREHRHGGKRV